MIPDVGDDVTLTSGEVGRVVGVSLGADLVLMVPRGHIDAWVARIRSAWGENWRTMYFEVQIVMPSGRIFTGNPRDILSVRRARAR